MKLDVEKDYQFDPVDVFTVGQGHFDLKVQIVFDPISVPVGLRAL